MLAGLVYLSKAKRNAKNVCTSQKTDMAVQLNGKGVYKLAIEPKMKPCIHMPGYREGDSVNGVDCDEFRVRWHCDKCGFNPKVARQRLIKIVGEKRADELMALTRKLSEDYRKEHPLI